MAASGTDASHNSVHDPDIFNAFGQFISGMARMSKATGDSAILDKASFLIDEWAKAMDPDGYFYYSRKPQFPHYIYEKTVCGLVDMYAYGGNKNAISHLERITDWANKNLGSHPPRAASPANAASAPTERNGTRCRRISTAPTSSPAISAIWTLAMSGTTTTIGACTTLRIPGPTIAMPTATATRLSSAAMSYAVSPIPNISTPSSMPTISFQRTQVYATGGFGPDEELMPPDGSLGESLDTKSATFETGCGSWAIFKLSRYLMSFTGQAKYGDWVEKMFYNGIGGGLPMQPDGHTFYYSDYRVGGGTKVYREDQKWCCCSGTYSQAIADYHNLIYLHDNDALYVNLFVPSEVTWKGITLTQETSYPESQTSTLTVRSEGAKQLPLRIRIPGWCKGASLSVNGQRQSVSCSPGAWATLDRKWSSGDKISIELPMEILYAPVDEQHPKRIALVYGPTVLVKRPRRFSADSLRALGQPGQNLSFKLPSSGEDEFVPFYSMGFHEPYEMYFDIA